MGDWTDRFAKEADRNQANEMKGSDAACKEDFSAQEELKKIEDGSVLSVDTTP